MLPDRRPTELDCLVDDDDDEDGAEEDDDGQGEGAAVQDALLGPGLRLVVTVLVMQPPLAQGPHGARVLHQARGQEDATLHRLVRDQRTRAGQSASSYHIAILTKKCVASQRIFNSCSLMGWFIVRVLLSMLIVDVT